MSLFRAWSDEAIEGIIAKVKAEPDSPIIRTSMVPDLIDYYERRLERQRAVFMSYTNNSEAVIRFDPAKGDDEHVIRGIVYTWPDLPPEKLRGNGRPTKGEKMRLTKRYRRSGKENGLVIRQELERIGITPPIQYGRLTWYFYRSAHQQADVNNFVSGMKAFQDGLIDAQVFVEDSSDHMIEGAHQLRSGTDRTEITIEELARP